LERWFAEREGRGVRATHSWVFVALAMLVISLMIADVPERLPSITVGDTNRLDGVGITSVVVLNLLGVALAVWGVAGGVAATHWRRGQWSRPSPSWATCG
jgi:hypothetical protein